MFQNPFDPFQGNCTDLKPRARGRAMIVGSQPGEPADSIGDSYSDFDGRQLGGC